MQSLLNHPSLMDCRRLFLRNYEVMINIGVHDFEKQGEQRVLFTGRAEHRRQDDSPHRQARVPLLAHDAPLIAASFASSSSAYCTMFR